MELGYTVTAKGAVADIKVLDSNPPGVFEKAASNAVARLRYKPVLEDGKAVAVATKMLVKFRARDLTGVMMKLSLSRSFAAKLSADRLVVLVIFLGLGFVATVLVPGLRLSSQLVNTSAALKWVADQQRYPTIIRASLETMRDRLTNRGYLQESVDQLTDATKKLDEALGTMTAPRPGGWLSFAGFAGAESIAGRRAGPLHDAWNREREVLGPVLSFSSVPYADSESAGTVLNTSGHQLDHDLTAAIRVSRHALPELETELGNVGAELQAANTRAARQLQW